MKFELFREDFQNELYRAYKPYIQDFSDEPSVNRVSLAMRDVDTPTWLVQNTSKITLRLDLGED